MVGLPYNSIFRETVKKSLIVEIVQLWKRSMQAEQKKALSQASPESQNTTVSTAA